MKKRKITVLIGALMALAIITALAVARPPSARTTPSNWIAAGIAEREESGRGAGYFLLG